MMPLQRNFIASPSLRLIIALVIIWSIDLCIGWTLFISLPNPKNLIHGTTLQRTSATGKVFTFTVGSKNPRYTPLAQIPKYLQSAVISLEDDRFYIHRGFDFEAIHDALGQFLQGGRRLRGASTLSQQLVKNLYLSHERSFKRKFLEALITVKMEAALPKSKILEIYLNSIDWGRGLFGIAEASQFYFKKKPKDLALRECVFLAAIVPNPARFGKGGLSSLPPQFVRRQMTRSLEELFQNNTITLAEYEATIRNLYGPENIEPPKPSEEPAQPEVDPNLLDKGSATSHDTNSETATVTVTVTATDTGP